MKLAKLGIFYRCSWYFCRIAALLAIGCHCCPAQTYYTPFNFTTIAGSPGYGNEDGTGSSARFYKPCGVAVDNAGNVYVADSANHTIRKVTPAGVVTTLAGVAGQYGNADGTGSAARLAGPKGLAVDNAGNLYVADYYNNTIRKVTPTGIVTTLTGSAGSAGSTDGTGSAAQFNGPSGMAVDSAGNVYVADSGNHTIRKVTPAGVVTTLAGLAGQYGTADGTGIAARFTRPKGVAVDNAGNVYVADYSTIRKVTPVGVVTTLAGLAGVLGSADGAGSAARFNNPWGVAEDSTGNLYVADYYNYTIRKVTPAGVVTTLAGLAGSWGSTDGMGRAARFGTSSGGPTGVAVDGNGNVYVADYWNRTIRKVTPTGVVTTLAGPGDGMGSRYADGVGSNAGLLLPEGVAADSVGNVYVADTDNNTIRKVTTAGMVTTLGGDASIIDQFHNAVGGSADGLGSAARFNSPAGVAVDSASNVYVADRGNNTIRKGWTTNPTLQPPTITNGPAPDGTVGQSYSFQFTASGSPTPSFSVVSGNLPPGLYLSASGLLAGTPSQSGKFPFTVQAANGVNPPAQQTEPGNIAPRFAISSRFDFNGDGKPDFLWESTNGEHSFWYMNGPTNINWGLLDPNIIAGHTNRVVGIADFNGDGQADLLWEATVQGGSKYHTVWFMNGNTVIGWSYLHPNILVGPEWHVAGCADFNGDGSPDFLWESTNGEHTIWYMSGVTNVNWSYLIPNISAGSTNRVVGIADFNGDGQVDLLWEATVQGGSKYYTMWFMNGNSNIGWSYLNPSGLVPPEWGVAGCADFNGDGKPDILWESTKGEHTIWYMNGITNINWSPLIPNVTSPGWRIVLH